MIWLDDWKNRQSYPFFDWKLISNHHVCDWWFDWAEFSTIKSLIKSSGILRQVIEIAIWLSIKSPNQIKICFICIILLGFETFSWGFDWLISLQSSDNSYKNIINHLIGYLISCFRIWTEAIHSCLCYFCAGSYGTNLGTDFYQRRQHTGL